MQKLVLKELLSLKEAHHFLLFLSFLALSKFSLLLFNEQIAHCYFYSFSNCQENSFLNWYISL